MMPANVQKFSRAKRTKGNHSNNVVSYVVLTIMAIVCLVPIFFAVSGSIHTNTSLYLRPFTWIPHHASFGNYQSAWNATSFGGAMVRSFVIALVISVASVSFGLMAAYGIAKFRFRG